MYEPALLDKVEENIQSAKATVPAAAGSQERIEQLLEANLDYARRIYADTQRIRHYMRWRVIISIVWIVLLVAPFIVAAIYLPPLVNQVYSVYQPLLFGDTDILNLVEELQKVK